MKIPVLLNGEKTFLEASAQDTLLTVLRNLNLFSVKCGCNRGICGNCMILLDDEPVPSCIIPAAAVRDREIVTLEYFKNNPIYLDIINGFSNAGIHLCGYCNTGKIFTAYKILKDDYRPDVKKVLETLSGLNLCCTDNDTLANGIFYAVSLKHIREGKNGNNNK